MKNPANELADKLAAHLRDPAPWTISEAAELARRIHPSLEDRKILLEALESADPLPPELEPALDEWRRALSGRPLPPIPE